MYEIHGKSEWGEEVIDTDLEGYAYAKRMLAEYQMAYGSEFQLWLVDAETNRRLA